jgi:hypothetical protein
MSTNIVSPDTTRTKQKSQLMDDPYIHNLHLQHILTELLDVNVYTSNWFHEVSKVLNIRKKELTDEVLLGTHWKYKLWGTLHKGVHKGAIIWVRPDGGDDIYYDQNLDIKIKIIRFMLMATLIEVLSKLDMSSYEKVGVTKNWQRAKVKLNGVEVQGVVWADALTGSVTTDDNYEDVIHTRYGHINIILEKENLSFF